MFGVYSAERGQSLSTSHSFGTGAVTFTAKRMCTTPCSIGSGCTWTSPRSSSAWSSQPRSGSPSAACAVLERKAPSVASVATRKRVPPRVRRTADASAPRRPRAGGLIRDRVTENAQIGDLDLDRIAGLHPKRRLAARADTAGRSGDDHVAGQELRPLRAILDQLRDVEAKLADALVLHDFAVQARREAQLARVGYLVGRHEPRSERAARVKVLTRSELLRVALVVAHAAVVEACVARDVVERGRASHAARAPADHDGELA